MSTVYSQASIIVPQSAGYQADILHAWNPQTSSLVDFDVVRNTTATRVNESGLIESVAANVPRIDWPIGGGCPSLLVEPQRTNLLTYSEEFDDADWVKDAGGTGISPIVSSNAATAPDGALTADRVTFNLNGGTSSSDRSAIIQTVTTAIGTYTRSVYLKSGDGNNYDIIIATTSGPASFLKVSVTPEWQRFSLSVDATSANPNFLIGLRNAGGVTGLSDVAVIDCWGAQLEAGSNATSYIPTTSAAVTRNADVISKTGISSLIGQTEGTIFIDFNWEQKDGAYFLTSLDDNTSDNQIIIAIGSTLPNRVRFQINTSGVNEVNFDSSAITNGRHKIALSYAANNVTGYIDGVQISSDTSASIPATSEYKFARFNDSFVFHGGINNAAHIPVRLTNAELAALTTL